MLFNRGTSMLAGGGGSSGGSGNFGLASPSSFDANALTDARSLHHANNDVSPLQIFVRAKKKINDIFGEIEEYVVDTTRFIDGKCYIFNSFNYASHYLSISIGSGLATDDGIVDKAEAEQFRSYVHKVSGIREVLSRDHMKVVFFGRTSNGKSSVINAMLREKILPSGMGHTTNCFCQVEGINGQEAYLVKEGSDEKLNVVVSGVL